MLEPLEKELSRAVFNTIAYADIFDYPLTAREIHHYLSGAQASLDEVLQTLEEDHSFVRAGDYFTLPGREEIVPIRMERAARSRELMPRAMQYGRILGALPYVRMVALTGSLAVMNVTHTADFDYMLVTTPGRVWTARACALAFNRFTRLQGYTLCPNLILSEHALEWSIHDLYSARELCQMIPITGLDIYSRLMRANQWVATFLPNAYIHLVGLPAKPQEHTCPGGQCQGVSPRRQAEGFEDPAASGSYAPALQSFLEIPLRGKLGNRFERWEMNRKIARFSRQQGFGDETVFNADVCQGNFDHHASWTREALEKRIAEFELV